MAKRGKGKKTRKRSKKVLERKRLKRNKYKASKWKLDYPKIFKEIHYFPFIVRRDDERY